MIGFGIFLLAPKLMSYEAMAAESYLLFAVWSLLGLLVFRFVLFRDEENEYGHSIIVWIALLLLMLMTIMMWVDRQTQIVTDESIEEIQEFYKHEFEEGIAPGKEATLFLAE